MGDNFLFVHFYPTFYPTAGFVSARRIWHSLTSHIKPWKNCDNAERLDGHNGLMLAPHVDKLFDRGWISFGNNGELLVADRACAVLRAWGLSQKLSAGKFNNKQRSYLAYHREVVFQS